MFKGHHVNTINEKGRLSIPSRFRELLNESGADHFVVTKSVDPCLWVFTPEGWERLEKIASGLSTMDRLQMAFIRHVVGSAEDCPVDAQGRILIPMSLRSYAGLKKKCLIVGLINRIEIWNNDTYDVETSGAFEQLRNSREALAAFGL
ncbi:MAG TPA: division/cell wall cluster transcriptional repressor MraZ [Deltaproteobacteria bacterium]|nr:division/cell wall cluster transcriptional repressor MraZ [Deltaproteobacteria bacterium]HOM28910.1 division/cell wall cluster transcriptional repressor MraZ [Deltaproteobacteria bacterium]HPP80159.1 division/cell wall cluster transcriptional repressor MraZ [Deltaproteobacteria bacterium]